MIYNWFTLITQGPLTTQWTPPASCLSTTTKWGSYRGLFLGFHQEVGIDLDCYPSLNPMPTAAATTSPLLSTGTTTEAGSPKVFVTVTGFTTYTPAPTITKTPLWPTRGIVSDVAYYSPGICPSGYSYAVSFTDGQKAQLDESRYLCCPSGYTVNTYMSTSRITEGGRVTASLYPSYMYPSCSRTTTSMSNVWSLAPGWPTVKPTSYALEESVIANRYESFAIQASGVVVGWRPQDAAVVDYLKSNDVQLPK
jgi:hypothetical protein